MSGEDQRWINSEMDELRKLWPQLSARQIGKILHRTRNAVIGKADRLNLPEKKRKSWPSQPSKPRDLSDGY